MPRTEDDQPTVVAIVMEVCGIVVLYSVLNLEARSGTMRLELCVVACGVQENWSLLIILVGGRFRSQKCLLL
jgi:hypothetical protein